MLVSCKETSMLNPGSPPTWGGPARQVGLLEDAVNCDGFKVLCS